VTSRERVLLVLKHRFADQVPVAEMWIDPGVARAVMPGARDGNDAAVRLDMDMVTAPTMIYGPDEIAADVVAATEWLLETVSAAGPHILSSGNTIAASVKPENFVAMVRTAQTFRRRGD